MTIVFADDWYQYPDAIVHTDTKNKTFIRISALLREMGIKNHLFPLQLHNPDLRYVDPFSPHISMEEMMMVALECKSNLYYFLREIVRDPNGSIHNPISYKADRANMSVSWLFLNHITTIEIIQRQAGKSFGIDSLSEWAMNIASTDTDINLLTKDNTLRSRNLVRLKGMMEELPYYLRQLQKTDVANTEEIKISSMNNNFRGHLPSKSPKQALNVGRGSTSPISLVDELAFIYNIAISLPAMLAAGTAARGLAAEKGEPYGTILYTTAGKKDDRDGRYAYNMIQNSANWNEKFYDVKDTEELEFMIRQNSPGRNLRVYCTFSHRQLGFTDEWLRKAMEDAESKGEDAARDYLNQWTSGSQQSPIPPELADIIRLSEVRDHYSEIAQTYAYITRWYIPETAIHHRMNNGYYIMSLDTSDASGGDDIGLVITDIKSGETIAAGNYNETNLISFAEWLCQWLVRYSNLLLIVERRSTGSTILDYLLLMLPKLGIDPFTRLYNKVVQEADENKERYKEICKPMYARPEDIYVKHKKAFGYATSANGATSRSELYGSTLMKTVKMMGDKIRDPLLIDQMLSLVIRNNRVDHEEGAHDDLVIAKLLGSHVIFNGRNLQHYGINGRDLLSENKVNQEENNPKVRYEKAFNEHIRRQIESLVEQIKKERDHYVCLNLENQLKVAYSKLCEEDRQMFAVDDLINSLRENRHSGRTHQAMYR